MRFLPFAELTPESRQHEYILHIVTHRLLIASPLQRIFCANASRPKVPHLARAGTDAAKSLT
jgi:hypothetical protein